MKPSDIAGIYPWNSVERKCESETVARNIAIILARTGDEWKILTWDTYAEERRKDSGVIPQGEFGYFEAVKKYFISEQSARSFSKEWNL